MNVAGGRKLESAEGLCVVSPTAYSHGYTQLA
jgi:hypothetical protein